MGACFLGIIKIPQVGTVRIDDDVEIGANSTIDRARFGKTWIKTGVKIDINDEGFVFIAGTDREMTKKAYDIVHGITREVLPGEVFLGKVTRLMNFGAFVEILPNKEGLVHISKLDTKRVEKVEDIVNVVAMTAVRA